MSGQDISTSTLLVPGGSMAGIPDLNGRVAVVTGGAMGIGRAIAVELIHAGAQVVIADIDDTVLEQTAEDVGAHPRVADVTDALSMQTLAQEVVTRFGRVDIIVNNAGVGVLAAFDDLTPSDFHRLMNVNFWGVLHGIKSFLPLLRANPDGGHIVNMSSMAGMLPAQGLAAYSASKAAVIALSEALTAELSDDRIGISVAVPGRVRTDINKNAGNRSHQHSDDGGPEAFLPPTRRLEPKRVGQLVVRGIRSGEPYIVTHPEMLSEVQARHGRIQSSFTEQGPLSKQ